MKYTKYHPTTGEVTSLLTITDSNSLQANLPDNNYLEGHYHPDEHYIDVATKTAVAKSAKPSANHVWNADTKIWTLDTNKLSGNVRGQRNSLLLLIDKVNPVWFASLTAEQQDELKQYRQLLLNVPQQSGFPTNVSWPIKPDWL